MEKHFKHKRKSALAVRYCRLELEQLEERIVLSVPSCLDPGCLNVPLLPTVDLFGSQIGVIQVYQDPSTVVSDANGVHVEVDENESRGSFGIFDTGASVISFSANDQLLFDFLGTPIEIKIEDGASADAIGGTLTGDVSQPGPVLTDGLHAWVFDPLDIFNSGFDLSNAAALPNTQAFVGTTDGSAALPNIVGTPILSPSPVNPQGLSAEIDMLGYALDLAELFPELFAGQEDLIIYLPDIQFPNPDTPITVPGDGSTTTPVRIPLSLWGVDNTADPGDFISVAPNPVQAEVGLFHGDASVVDQTLLFDTGAQLSVISTPVALGLGIDLEHPITTITVQGAGGTAEIPGYVIDAIQLPRDDDGDGTIDGTLLFTDVPVFVLDVIEGLDGILGMNMFNGARSLLYDPNSVAGASLSVTFLNDRLVPDLSDDEITAINALGFSAFAGVVSNGFPTARLEGSGGWQNPFNQFDVDGSGDVSVVDFFEWVDYFSLNGEHDVDQVALNDGQPFSFADVDGNLTIDTVDAFEWINHYSLQGQVNVITSTLPVVSLGAIGFENLKFDADGLLVSSEAIGEPIDSPAIIVWPGELSLMKNRVSLASSVLKGDSQPTVAKPTDDPLLWHAWQQLGSPATDLLFESAELLSAISAIAEDVTQQAAAGDLLIDLKDLLPQLEK